MADGASRLAEEDRLAAQLGLRRLLLVEPAEVVELRNWREVEQLLELGHRMDLAAAFEVIGALPHRGVRFAVEVRRPLLELGEVLDRFERALRAEQALDVDATQRRHVDAVPERLRPNIADDVCRRVGVAETIRVYVRSEKGFEPVGY